MAFVRGRFSLAFPSPRWAVFLMQVALLVLTQISYGGLCPSFDPDRSPIANPPTHPRRPGILARFPYRPYYLVIHDVYGAAGDHYERSSGLGVFERHGSVGRTTQLRRSEDGHTARRVPDSHLDRLSFLLLTPELPVP